MTRRILGAVADILSDGNRINGYRACLPDGVARKELVKVVKAWLDRHPDLLKSRAHLLSAQALSERYPCPAGE